MDLSKSLEWFNPYDVKQRINIIGCGSVGSTVAELLARFGFTKFNLYDFDKVEKHNIANQMFDETDLYKPKVEQVAAMITRINPEAANNIKLFPEGWQGNRLSGYVFLAVDNIELRRKIVEENLKNQYIEAMFDFRTGLTDAQHFAANWHEETDKTGFLNSMDFSHEEAMASTPMSACHISLCVAPTVRLISNYGVMNFINYLHGAKIRKYVGVDIETFEVEVY